MEHTKCLIIGSGPAGYTAAIYAGRANLQPIEYCGLQTGGQLTQTTIVENFPGYPEGVDANQMMMELREQAERFGADIRDGVVTAADLSKRPYIVTIDDGTQIEADTIIIATGASACRSWSTGLFPLSPPCAQADSRRFPRAIFSVRTARLRSVSGLPSGSWG